MEDITKYSSNFGGAVAAMQEGLKVTRTGWNGKGMYVYLVPGNSYPPSTKIAEVEFGDLVPYSAYFAMKNAQGTVNPWTITNTDVLADDWIILK